MSRISTLVFCLPVITTHSQTISESVANLSLCLYCVLVDGHIEVVSGHHRIRAAREASLEEVPVLVDESGLSRQEIVAKQLAHNRIAGFDDQETLRRLFEMLDEPGLILETGLANEMIDLPKVDLETGITPSLNMDWKVVTLTFLPHQIKDFTAVIDMIPPSDLVGVAPMLDYQKFIDALISYARYKNVRNLGTALAVLADIALAQIAEAEAKVSEDG